MAEISIKVFLDRENKNEIIGMGRNSRVIDLLNKLNINPVTVIVTRNNELILEDKALNNNNEIKILSVISGG